MSDAPPRDHKHRDLASGLNGGLAETYLVEAGAGTGKTTVLVSRLLELVRAGTRLPKVVAITFTEKAASELRIRLRQKLEEAAAGEGRPAEREIFDRALRELDRAHVGTIHGFCSSLLHERPVEARVDPNFGVADSLSRSLLLDDVWDGWSRAQFERTLPPPVAAAVDLGTSVKKIREIAFKLCDERDQLGALAEPLPPGDVNAFVADLHAAANDFTAAAAESCINPGDSGAAGVRDFARAITAIDFLPEDGRTAYVLGHLAIAFGGKHKGNKKNWDGDALASLRERAGTLRTRQAELRAIASHNAAVGLLSWLGGFVDAYEDEKARRGVLDFQDLLIKARDLLRDDLHVRAYFQRAFERILVDEFQDTDPLQSEIVFFLAEKERASDAEERGGAPKASDAARADWTGVELERGKLFIVGDPKQSIYRFRRADIEMYEHAKAVIEAQGAVLTLTENFRTRGNIVDGVNAVFSEAMHPPEDDRHYQPEYAALGSFRGPDDRGPGIVILPPTGPLTMEGSEDPLKVDEIRAREAAAVAALIDEATGSGELIVRDKGNGAWRPAGLSDIAVLFPAMTGIDAYESALENRGIEYRVAGGRRFYVRREVRELATVLAAIEDPHNAVAVVGALRTPFLGVSDEDILRHFAGTRSLNYLDGPGATESLRRAFGLLRELHRDRNGASITNVIETLFDRTKILELFLMKPSGEQRHANLRKVVEIATALERSDPMAFGGFARWLRQVTQLTPEESESPLAEEGDEFVRLMTIHGSKGLEFPVTVLAFLGHGTDHPPSLIVDREGGQLGFGIGKDGEGIETRGFAELKELERRRHDAERIRLLYVAMTRTRDSLVIPWFVNESGGRKSPRLLSHLTGLRDGAGDPVGSLATLGAYPSVVRFDTTSLTFEHRAGRSVRLDTAKARAIDPKTTDALDERARWRAWLNGLPEAHDRPRALLAPSALEGEAPRKGTKDETSDREAAGGTAAPPRAPGARTDGFAGPEFGTLVHDVLEALDFEEPEGAHAIARALARRTGLGADFADAAAALAAGAVETDIIRRARESSRAEREVPFSLALDGGILEGKIDLLFEEEDGWVIVDYKTDVLDGRSADDVAEIYFEQALAYARAVTAILPKPAGEVVLLFLRPEADARGRSGPHEISVPVSA